MKKIISGVGMIVFVAAIVASGTGAFFSDTETSTGNVFTAGAIDLTVDSEAHYNGSICLPNLQTTQNLTDYTWQGGTEYPVGLPCNGTWAATDLGAHTFFNYDDVKPGDEGENTISLHVSSNEAYACVDVSITSNDDVDCVDPENGVEGEACPLSEPALGDADEFDGDLAQNLNFFAWLDEGATPGFNGDDVGEGDNIYQANEIPLFSNIAGPASDVLGGVSYTLADSRLGALEASTTYYIGLAWCAGDFTDVVLPGINLDCDGSTMGNEAQTDELIADIAFRVEQARHNENFSCTPQTAPETGTVTLDKIVTFTSTSTVGVDVNDFTLHLVGPGGDHVLVDQVAFPGLIPGAYVVSEVYSNDPAGIQFNASFSGSCTEIDDTGTANMNVVAGVNPTCTITNLVVSQQG